ncbi:tyrosine aminotransferase isoform 2 [Galdieria sulphuraria]|uniref:Tyrosine aminotransferase isoform 2 n=1 Tax=Galdieria sulphuraria TaxID=130081 RepID=M2XSX8_GALSU|nr:tyrosine aminotransferase isoform 2 [Galdieria sulphuraria]EME26768.1 tyrosine aminotransferase isoform 2 [Galdieria sulphuraria]|eukprot:XP_005703288.1 tyrosine aminotransferase isoform 2 [Galdieria sulphuraria]
METVEKGQPFPCIEASSASLRTSNPIREVVDRIDTSQMNKSKPMIPLSIGDPTVFGNLNACEETIQAVVEVTKSCQANGYPKAVGMIEARTAIAKEFTVPNCSLTPADVILTSGCSHALQLCLEVLLEPGKNILIPNPGFPLYKTICDYIGAETRGYKLSPERGWQIDLKHLRALIDSNTRAILINNPSNPCGKKIEDDIMVIKVIGSCGKIGAVYPKSHLCEILKVAEEAKLPIIADEIYHQIVFPGNESIPIASLTNVVPVLSVGGLAKRFLVPGWRLGWIIVYDHHNVFSQVREGLERLSTLIMGANSLIQAALPKIIQNVPTSWHLSVLRNLHMQANYSYERLSHMNGLEPVMPQGSMYIMVGIQIEKSRDIKNDIDFCQKLLNEESVFVLPGQCFGASNYFRIVFCAPMDKLAEAYNRMSDFCRRHMRS